MILAMFAASLSFQAAEPPPPPALVEAGEAWTQCISDGIDGAAANAEPRAAARTILGACSALQGRMTTAHMAWIDSSGMSATEKSEARAAVQRSVAAIEGQIVRAIRASRED